MKERPILMSAPMVRALLDGSKTQTRRVVKPQPPADWDRNCWYSAPVWGWTRNELPSAEWHKVRCPYGQPGDRLWVRENFAHFYRDNKEPAQRQPEDIAFAADGLTPDHYVYGGWKPSIHMPRWASRINLEITNVRVERLQDISEADALAEGVETWRAGWDEKTAATAFLHGTQARIKTNEGGIAQRLYYLLWEQINGAGSWDTNPWVWVVEFKRINHG